MRLVDNELRVAPPPPVYLLGRLDKLAKWRYLCPLLSVENLDDDDDALCAQLDSRLRNLNRYEGLAKCA